MQRRSHLIEVSGLDLCRPRRIELKSEISPIDLWLVSLHHKQVHHPPPRQLLPPETGAAGATRASSAGDTYGGTSSCFVLLGDPGRVRLGWQGSAWVHDHSCKSGQGSTR